MFSREIEDDIDKGERVKCHAKHPIDDYDFPFGRAILKPNHICVELVKHTNKHKCACGYEWDD